MNNSMGFKIRATRLNLGVTSKDLAMKLGVSSTMISNVELHGEIPSMDLFIRLVRSLGMDQEKMFILYKKEAVKKHKVAYENKIKRDLKEVSFIEI